jgi:hypothetical protein
LLQHHRITPTESELMSFAMPRFVLSALILSIVCSPLAAQTKCTPQSIAGIAKRYNLEIVTEMPRFPIKISTGTIDGAEASKAEVESYLSIFAFEWSLYPADLVKRTGLKKVVLCQKLSFEKQYRTGIPDFENDALYLDVTRGRHDDRYVRKVIHHEFFHIIDLRDDGKVYEDERWSNLNPPTFRYGPGGAKLQDDPTVTITGKDAPGFLNRYATAGVEEDKAEFFAHMIVEPKMIAERVKKDKYVHAKVERMTELLAEFSPRVNKEFWETVDKTER